MFLKSSVKVSGLQPEILLAVIVAQGVLPTLTITSICDDDPGRKTNSKHKIGQAFDIRIKDLVPAIIPNLVNALKAALTKDYDVVLEYDHIHIEFDPK